MAKNLGSKPFIYAFFSFLLFLSLTMIASYYTKQSFRQWSIRSTKEISEGVLTLIDMRFNQYKLNFYGLMNMYRSTVDYPDLAAVLNKDKTIRDAFGKLYLMTDVVTDEQNPLSGRAKTALNIAIAENRPVFFNTEKYEGKYYLGVVFPVEPARRSYVLSYLDYGDLFLGVERSAMLDGINQVHLDIYTIVEGQRELVFRSHDVEEENVYLRKIGKGQEINETLDLDGVRLELVFFQSRFSDLAVISKNVPFSVLVAGTVLSVVVFGGVFVTMLVMMRGKTKDGI